MITLKKSKTLKEITEEWDRIASFREKQVQSQKDHSANYILAPSILNELRNSSSTIDIGCGTGWLTIRASEFSKDIVGVDPSRKSIEIANSNNSNEFTCYHSETIEEYSKSGVKFNAAISNMSVSCSPDLTSFLMATRKVLNTDGLFVFTIPHPCFWPIYWGYSSDPTFEYNKTFAVEGEFKIQNEISPFLTTHFHHPLELYVKAIQSACFKIEAINELEGKGFPFPRFVLIKLKAV
jgi:2-polyprenyl-3-methyl-5-hydroxy-6-metoxy-1,4-benzoquinol methylase